MLTKRKSVIIILFTVLMLLFGDMSAYAVDSVTWNPNDKSPNVILSNDNMTAKLATRLYSSGHYLRATEGKDSGKWYWEIYIDSTTTGGAHIGIASQNAKTSESETLSIYNYDGKVYLGSKLVATGTPYKSDDNLGFALDLDNKKLSIYKNGALMVSDLDISELPTLVYPYAVSGNKWSGQSLTITANFGASNFSYAVPDGYLPYTSQPITTTVSGLNATIADTLLVNLSWDAVSDVTNYNIYRSTTQGSEYTLLGSSTANSYTDNDVTNATTYYYVVTAITSTGESNYSNEASATPLILEDDQLYVLLDIDEQALLSVSHDLADSASLTWTSSDSEVASVDANGKVMAIGEGNCKIYAASSDNTFFDYMLVKVIKGAEELRLALHLNVGESKRLWITDDYTNVSWSSMDTATATVDATGRVTGVGRGLCLVQGVYNGQTYVIYARVNN